MRLTLFLGTLLMAEAQFLGRAASSKIAPRSDLQCCLSPRRPSGQSPCPCSKEQQPTNRSLVTSALEEGGGGARKERRLKAPLGRKEKERPWLRLGLLLLLPFPSIGTPFRKKEEEEEEEKVAVCPLAEEEEEEEEATALVLQLCPFCATNLLSGLTDWQRRRRRKRREAEGAFPNLHNRAFACSSSR